MRSPEPRRRGSLCPEGSIQSSVLNGFGDVFGQDRRGQLQIGNRARDFQDSIVGPGTQALLRDSSFQQALTVVGEFTKGANLAGGHLRVAVDSVGVKPLQLYLAGSRNTSADCLRTLGRSARAQLFVVHGRHVDENVNAVEQRT